MEDMPDERLAAALAQRAQLERARQAKSNPDWYLARGEQPFAGLTNEGATCYLNSLLQALYHLPAVRREVYAFEHAPAHGTHAGCVPYQLAALFASIHA